MAVGTPNAVDFLSPRIWTGFVRALPRPQELIGDQFLPRRNVDADRLMWTLLDRDLPVSPMVSLGTESPRLDGNQARTAWADILYTRFKRVLREQDLRILRSPDFQMMPAIGADAAGLAGAMRRNAEQYIRDEATRLSEAVDRRVNLLQLQALLGTVTVAPDEYNDLNYTIATGVTTQTASPLWSDTTNGDPLLDMSNWFLNLRWQPARAIMTYADVFNLQRSAKIRAQVFANVPTGANTATIMPRQGILDWLRGEFGLDITVTRSVYTTRANDGTQFTYTEHQYIPNGKMIILPAQAVGYTAEAPAQLNNYDYGKFTFAQDPTNGGPIDPPETMFGCGWYGLPIIDHPEQVIVATIG